jgi:hypothetical protein
MASASWMADFKVEVAAVNPTIFGSPLRERASFSGPNPPILSSIIQTE